MRSTTRASSPIHYRHSPLSTFNLLFLIFAILPAGPSLANAKGISSSLAFEDKFSGSNGNIANNQFDDDDDDGDFNGFSSNVLSSSKKAVDNLQTFTGALGGFRAPKITQSTDATRPFQVDGTTFADFQSAGERTCQRQLSQCQNAASLQFNTRNMNMNQEPAVLSGIESRVAFNTTDCQNQKANCESAQRNAPFQTFNLDNLGPDPLDPGFDLYCAP